MPKNSALMLNRNAREILEQKVIPFADELGVKILHLPGGSTVIDMGIHCRGGFVAARHFVEACLGGLGALTYGKIKLKTHWVPSVRVMLTEPAIAIMSAFIASYRVPWKGHLVSLSGPGRCIKDRPEDDHFAHAISYYEPEVQEAVFCIQTTDLPDEELAGELCRKTGVPPEGMFIVAAPTGCVVGAVQVCARNVEQALPTLVDRGFPLGNVVEAYGVTPVVSITDAEEIAYGRVNDCLIYGQVSTLYVRCEDEEITQILEEIPFSKNRDVYGLPFQELFARCENDWVKVPRDWDAPCRLVFMNLKTGNTFSTGSIGYDTLQQSFMGKDGFVV